MIRMIRSLSRTIPTLAAFLVMACVTVNIYFPAPAVREAAEEITEETWGQAADAEIGPAAAAQRELERLGAWFAPASALAADPDINVSTASIRALKSAMGERALALKPALAAGHIGVASDGSLAVRDFAGVSLMEQAKTRRLLEAENRDRLALYREIAGANSFGPDKVDDVQTIFAETWIAQAKRAGWWTRSASGTWSAP